MTQVAPPPRPILGSWKEIALFLKREVRTVQRWEKDEGLPVHRHYHQERSSIYAYADEVEAWWLARRNDVPATNSTPRVAGIPQRAAMASVVVAALGCLALWFGPRRGSAVGDAPALLGSVVAAGAPLVTPGSVALSPDSRTLYVSDWGARAIFSVSASGGRPTILASSATTGFSGLDTARFLEISLDGETLYVAGWGSRSIFAVSTSTGTVRTLASGAPLDRPHGVGLSSDGSMLFFTDNFAGKLYRIQVTGGEPVLIASGLREPEDVVAAGSSLFVTSGEAAIYRVTMPSGQWVKVTSGPPLVRPTGIALSEDRSTLFVVDDAGFGGKPPAAIYALPVSGGPLTRLFSGHPLLFPPDGALSKDGASLFVADAGYSAPGAIYRLDLFQPLAIDIEPGVAEKALNPHGPGEITVAVLTTGTRDARTVDPASARFGPRNALESHGRGHLEDVDGDGDADLVLHFVYLQAGLACDAGEAWLHARTLDGVRLRGSNSITTRCR